MQRSYSILPGSGIIANNRSHEPCATLLLAGLARLEGRAMTMYGSTSEAAVRKRAARLSYRVVKSRDHPHPDNQGLYMLVRNESGMCVLGGRFDATLEDINEYLANE